MAKRPIYFNNTTGLITSIPDGQSISLPIIASGLGSATTEPAGSLAVSSLGQVMYSDGSVWSAFGGGSGLTHPQILARTLGA